MRRKREFLREGFTTGSAAAAAAKGAVLAALGAAPSGDVEIPLPSPQGFGGRLWLPLSFVHRHGPLTASAEVVKDAGDDPDVTDGATIRCSVLLQESDRPQPAATCKVRVEGGQGVGRVTLPGLPVPVGFAAINPVPRRQIALAVAEALAQQASPCRSVDVLVEIPHGATLARKTMNNRLGIIGGLSVLGTSGIVKPFSHDSWRASVESGLDVARASGLDAVCLCTGRRSEALARREHPELGERAFVQMADLFSHAVQNAARRGFPHIAISCYGGKLAKMAQGLEHTHADSGRLDFPALAERCRGLGMSAKGVDEVREAITARRVFELAAAEDLERPLALELARAALEQARRHSGSEAALEFMAFSADDRLLARTGHGGRHGGRHGRT